MKVLTKIKFPLNLISKKKKKKIEQVCITLSKVQLVIVFEVTVEEKICLTISKFVLSDCFSHCSNRIIIFNGQKFSFKKAIRKMRHENKIQKLFT